MKLSTQGLALCLSLGVLACSSDERGAASASAAFDEGVEGGLDNDANLTESSDGGGGQTLRVDLGNSADDEEESGGVEKTPPGNMEEIEFSYIWIANTEEGTVSKIDTATVTEEARYRMGAPNREPSPSRTSVNLLGEVAVANRAGGPAAVVKISPQVESCIDHNRDGMITTAQEPGLSGALAFGEDECLLWVHNAPDDFSAVQDNAGGPRAIAWDAYEKIDPELGNVPQPRVWVGWKKSGTNNEAVIRRLAGDTGNTEAEVVIPWNDAPWGHGPYGGAVDADGAFWVSGASGLLVRIDADMNFQSFQNPQQSPPYGVTIDAHGRLWTASWSAELSYFDPQTQSFRSLGQPVSGVQQMRGLVVDENGHAWIAAHQEGRVSGRLIRYDTETQTVVNGNIALPGSTEPVGVSIDVEGMIWVVDRQAQTNGLAYRVNPNQVTEVEIVRGLVKPYTYSDMTGAVLRLVYPPPVD